MNGSSKVRSLMAVRTLSGPQLMAQRPGPNVRHASMQAH